MKLDDILDSLVSPNEYYDSKELYAEVVRCHRDIRLLVNALRIAAIEKGINSKPMSSLNTNVSEDTVRHFCNDWIKLAR